MAILLLDESINGENYAVLLYPIIHMASARIFSGVDRVDMGMRVFGYTENSENLDNIEFSTIFNTRQLIDYYHEKRNEFFPILRKEYPKLKGIYE